MKNWKELVPSVCLRVLIRDALKKVIQADKKKAVSQLPCKRLSKKPITELTPKATTLVFAKQKAQQKHRRAT